MSDFKVFVCITINDKFVIDSLTNIDYKHLLKKDKKDLSVEFFEKILADEDLNGICDIENTLKKITGIEDVQYVKPIYQQTSKKKKFLHELPYTFILFFTIVGILLAVEYAHEEITILSAEIVIPSFVIPLGVEISYILVHIYKYK